MRDVSDEREEMREKRRRNSLGVTKRDDEGLGSVALAMDM